MTIHVKKQFKLGNVNSIIKIKDQVRFAEALEPSKDGRSRGFVVFSALRPEGVPYSHYDDRGLFFKEGDQWLEVVPGTWEIVMLSPAEAAVVIGDLWRWLLARAEQENLIPRGRDTVLMREIMGLTAAFQLGTAVDIHAVKNSGAFDR